MCFQRKQRQGQLQMRSESLRIENKRDDTVSTFIFRSFGNRRWSGRRFNENDADATWECRSDVKEKSSDHKCSSLYRPTSQSASRGKLFIIQIERERKAKSHQRQHQLHIKKFSIEQWSCREHHLRLPAEPRSQSLTNHWGQSSRMDDQSAATII